MDGTEPKWMEQTKKIDQNEINRLMWTEIN